MCQPKSAATNNEKNPKVIQFKKYLSYQIEMEIVCAFDALKQQTDTTTATTATSTAAHTKYYRITTIIIRRVLCFQTH